ncbi:Nucleoporin 160kD [Carabus blaptoides fortunei]
MDPGNPKSSSGSRILIKQRVCLAVEQEIQTEVHEYEVTDEDYLEIANRLISFVSDVGLSFIHAVYNAAGIKPLGLLLLPAVSGVVLLKKSMYSSLRPLDALEQMMLCSECTTVEQFQYMHYAQLSQDADVCADLIQLMSVLVTLEQQSNEEFKYNIAKELCQLRSPDKVMSELVIDLMAGSDTPVYFVSTMSNCTDLYRTVHLLLEMLRLDNKNETKSRDTGLSKLMLSINHLFSSELGISIISECLQQQAVVRFSISRNLLLLQNILLER